MRKLTDKQRRTIPIEYAAGQSTTQLAKQYGVRDVVIARWVRKAGVLIRSPSQRHRKYFLDETVFNKINQNSAYWIGFLMADGCLHIRRGQSPQIKIGLQIRDIIHLENFRSFLKSGRKISIYTWKAFKYAQFSVQSEILANRLQAFGIVERKTSKAEATTYLANNRHFWRGVMDGDGSLRLTQNRWPLIQLSGSEKLMNQFIRFARLKNCHYTIHARRNSFQVCLTGEGAKTMAKILYCRSNVFLDRKKRIARYFMRKKLHNIKRKHFKWLSLEQKTKIKKLHNAGLTQERIAENLHISQSSVSLLLTRYFA